MKISGSGATCLKSRAAVEGMRRFQPKNLASAGVNRRLARKLGWSKKNYPPPAPLNDVRHALNSV